MKAEHAVNVRDLRTVLEEAFTFLDNRLRAGEPLDSSLRPMIGELIGEIDSAEEGFKLDEFRNRVSRVMASVSNALPG